jgi:hypothetical protein
VVAEQGKANISSRTYASTGSMPMTTTPPDRTQSRGTPPPPRHHLTKQTPMKIGIIQLYDDGRKGYGDLTGEVASTYCDAHGYTYVRYRDLIDPHRIATWNKLIAVQRELSAFEWVLWLDADALIVNRKHKIEDVITQYEGGKEMLFSSDNQGLCAGVFLAKNTEWVHTFLSAILLLGELPDCGHLYEQKTISSLYQLFPNVRERIGLIPDSVIQYPYSEFNRNAFIMHYWAISNPFERAEVNMRNIVKHGWAKPFMR